MLALHVPLRGVAEEGPLQLPFVATGIGERVLDCRARELLHARIQMLAERRHADARDVHVLAHFILHHSSTEPRCKVALASSQFSKAFHVIGQIAFFGLSGEEIARAKSLSWRDEADRMQLSTQNASCRFR